MHVCMHKCGGVHVPTSVSLGGECSCQISPAVSPGTILCALICEGQRKLTARALCYSSLLISSAFRPYLDLFLFIASHLFSGRRGREAWLTKKSPNLLSEHWFIDKNSNEKSAQFCFFKGISFFLSSWVSMPNVWELSLAWESKSFLTFLYFFSHFLVFFSCQAVTAIEKRPGWHGLSGFGGTQVAFDWRLAHGLWPWRESATLDASMHAHPLDCNIAMVTEAKCLLGYVCLFP